MKEKSTGDGALLCRSVVLQHLFCFRHKRHTRVHPPLQNKPIQGVQDGSKSPDNLQKQTQAVGRERRGRELAVKGSKQQTSNTTGGGSGQKRKRENNQKAWLLFLDEFKADLTLEYSKKK